MLRGTSTHLQCRPPCLEGAHQILLFRLVESVDEQGELLAYKKTKPCQTDQTVINIMHLNEGEYERLEKNCRISYIKTLLASVVSRKPTNKRGNLFKIRGYKVFLSDRKVKIGGVITLFRNLINARNIKNNIWRNQS